MSDFYAIDGESYTQRGQHKYVLLAGSDGRHIYDRDGLATQQCFDHILSLKQRRRILVCFGLTYDVNMMLRDLPEGKLRTLHETKEVYWRHYWIEHVPRKWFTIRDTRTKESVKIYEVFGYFQSSFVNALTAWGLEPPREILEGKALRSDFTEKQFAQILKYCIRECELLVQLMRSLRSSLYSVNIRPRTWNGAGTVAAALLNPAKPYHKHDIEHGLEPLEYILKGYFGGRVELYKQGKFPTIHNYDIRSAYPAEIQNLPDLSDGKWTKRKSFTAEYSGLWRVSWRNVRGAITPFPVRHKKQIYYPTTGDGIYHTAEVAAALDTGFNIKVHGGWTYRPSTDVKPFAFIGDLFEYRKELKAKNHAGEKAIKLGLNSVYGKLAQGQGYKGRLPRFQSYFWAGQVTAYTRAQLLRAIMTNPEAMVMVATDGIFSEEPLPIELGENLGDWETDVYTDMFTAQPGVYQGTKAGEIIKKSRGFFSREVDYDALIAEWEKEREFATYHYTSSRFIGLGSAMMRKDLSDWRTWKTENRKIALNPNRRHVHADVGSAILHYPPGRICAQSEPYIPRSDAMDAGILKDIVEGGEQPLASEV